MIDSLKSMIKKPLFYVLLFAFFCYVLAITWGLPSNETWFADSLAPYYPLMGLSKAFSFGYYHKYPLVHQVILAVLNVPVVIIAMINSNPLEGFQFLKFLSVIRTPEYATALILIDRLVSVAMGLGIIYYMYKAVELLFNEEVALFTSMIVAVNATMNQYAHVAKVEVPYIFWAVVALYYIVRIVKYETTRDYIILAVMIALSFGTKDQAYSFFVLTLPVYLIIYQLINKKDSDTVLSVVFRKNNWVFLASLIIMALLVENIIFNYDGFVKRLTSLTGESATRSISFTLGPLGIAEFFIQNMLLSMHSIMGITTFILTIAGIVLLLSGRSRFSNERFFGALFLVSALSYYLVFLQMIRQVNERFMLPITILIAPYGGLLLFEIYNKWFVKKKAAFAVMSVLLFMYPVYYTLSINANMIWDVRYTVEDWMETNIPEGSLIEYYSYIHYLPRFPENTFHYRIKNNSLDIEKRKPDYIVLSSRYYDRYTREIQEAPGRIIKSAHIKWKKSEFARFFDNLFSNRYKYREVKRFHRHVPFFKDIYRVSPEHIIIYKRTGDNKGR